MSARPLLEVLGEVIAQVQEDRWLQAEIAAGRACGDHERPVPCVECAA